MMIVKDTAVTAAFLLVDSSDHLSAETGLSPAVQISKNGGAFAATTNSAAEVGQGWYAVALTAAETDTAGPLLLRATAAGCDEWRDLYQVLDLAALVWAEPLGGYSAAGTAGRKLALVAETGDLPGEPPSAAQNATAVWGAALAPYDEVGSAGAALAAAAVGGASAGALEFTYTVDDGEQPLEGAEVWFSTDAAGAHVIWYGVTDAAGVALAPGDRKPFLDPGAYYAWVKKGGYSFPNPALVTVQS